jgi:hypothetical protein
MRDQQLSGRLQGQPAPRPRADRIREVIEARSKTGCRSIPCRFQCCSRRSLTTPARGGSCSTSPGGWLRRCRCPTGPLFRGKGDPAGVPDLTRFGQPVHALRVRHLDGPGISGLPIRALCGRHYCALRHRGPGPQAAGRHRHAAQAPWTWSCTPRKRRSCVCHAHRRGRLLVGRRP